MCVAYVCMRGYNSMCVYILTLLYKCTNTGNVDTHTQCTRTVVNVQMCAFILYTYKLREYYRAEPSAQWWSTDILFVQVTFCFSGCS